MLQLYGITQSRAFRPLWLLNELGLPFEHHPIDFRDPAINEPPYRSLNPNGRVPTLVDGDLVLFESMAINLYLARRYGADHGFWPDSPATEGLTWQWSFWVMTEVEQPLLTVLMHSRVLDESKREPDKVKRNLGVLKRPLAALDDALSGQEYLVDQRFTVADLNVASVLSWCKPARVSLRETPHLDAWLSRCLARPARKKAQRS